MKHRLLYTLSAVALFAATTAQAQTTQYPAAWQALGTVHMDAIAPNRMLVTYRQLGTGTTGDTADDTQTVNFTDCVGDEQQVQTAPWQTLDLTSLGVPATATQVLVNFKSVITKGTNAGDIAVYAWLRKPGADYGAGPSNAPQFAVPFCLPPGITTVQPAVEATAHGAVDTRREFTQVWAPVSNGSIEWSWGYIKTVPGNWPEGDALGLDLYLNGYAQ